MYLHFPANSGYLSQFEWNYKSNEHAKVSDDKLCIEKVGNSPAIIPTNIEIRIAKHYFQVRVIQPGSISVGLSTVSAINENNIVNPKHILLNSDGTVLGHQTEPFAADDLIGVLVDIEQNLVSFYKNNVLLHTLQGVLVANESYKFLAVLGESTSLSIVTGIPSNIDLLRIASDRASNEWGYKFTVTPELKTRIYRSIEGFSRILYTGVQR